ncbi:hypothetical protein M3D75_01615 [Microbacterium enclense]|uniref:hypothetical protein n=1 Tax=Microbacterium enclense TaxID=993073 RepID=UPI0021A8FD2B|nr:hypothetical protein [Microbacterium enclense]MCT2084808.1 hypothetical protein [Microbacterium enclense]
MRKTVRRVVAWGLAMGLAAVFGIVGAARAEIAPNAYFLPSQGVVGQELTLVGTGFPSDAEVLVSTDDRDQPSPAGQTNRVGNFTVSFTVPALAPGPQMAFITVEDVEWTVQFTVVASDASSPPDAGDAAGALWFEPPAGTVGQELQLIGLGFPADTDVSVTTSASPAPTLVGKSGSNGSFTLPFTVPDLAPGQH